MEILISGEKIFISDEFIEILVELSKTIFETIKEVIENISDIFQTLLEQSHYHCYNHDKTIHYYDRNKGCRCKKVTFKYNCGKKFYETYECYEPPPKQSDKSRVLKRNKRKHR